MAESGAKKKFDIEKYIAQSKKIAGEEQPKLFG
jgi:hypothetical protein